MLNRRQRKMVFSFGKEVYTLKQQLELLRKDPMKLFDYMEGSFRSFLYLNAPYFLTYRTVSDFERRIFKTRASECLSNGSCICCGCKSPAVMFASRGCSVSREGFCSDVKKMEPCYGKMKNIIL